MAFIGELIKKAVELSDKLLEDENHQKAQEETLRKLLEKAKSTEFGKEYRFRALLNQRNIHKAFTQQVPYHDYDRLRKRWWQGVIDGQENITWPGKPDYFAVSSGTTSKQKHIPVTDDMLKSIRRAGLKQVRGIADFDLPADFFEKEVLFFGSSTDLKAVNGHLEGEISGISASQIPFWFEGFYRPGNEIASIHDWDERVLALAKAAPNWDIGAISGIPSWIELMLKKVIEYHKVRTIHDIWPNFKVYTSGGVAFEPYQKSFEKITGQPIVVIDTYLASEGYIATQTRKDTDAMQLITGNGIYFEFVPFEPDNMLDDGSLHPKAPSIPLAEVEEDKDYVLVISTVAGAWRYMIGDTIRFTDKDRAEIKITGRTKHFLNVVGSQLSIIQMNEALKQLENEYDCDIKEFTVSAVLDEGEYAHRWYLGFQEFPSSQEKDLAKRLDEILQENNKNYKVARSKALKKVEVRAIDDSLFHEWTEKTKQKGGQVKFSRVMKEKDLQEWEDFLKAKA